ITLSHGSGGRQAQKLIHDHFATRFGMSDPMTDSAILTAPAGTIAFTTDSYVIDPIFFPGGNIGKLAVCGTVNDLAVSGAQPRYLSAAFIIEEGFGMEQLDQIVASMADEAEYAGVRIVTGDTKVVEKGKCDGIFINTAGVGILSDDLVHVSRASSVKEGDVLIINGPPGDHAVTILGARRGLSFDLPLLSDCASLNHLVRKIAGKPEAVHFMRDLTRGGLAAVLNELAAMRGCSITVDEASVPVQEPVRGLCEILGFDPLSLASEGRLLVVVAPGEAGAILERMHGDPLGRGAAVIGRITSGREGRVLLNGTSGGQRFLDMPSGQLLPRIC
ncbi:hydrogenase expression/formation protein HypE, partial [bacterium]|nr:hydrogenase expression/formation protein HypE [bacterium]